MGKHSAITHIPPFTPETLAERWQVSAASVRNKCASGALKHFRIGKLYRIPVSAVEEYETCPTSASVACEVDSASIGMQTASELGISLRHAPERKRKPRQ